MYLGPNCRSLRMLFQNSFRLDLKLCLFMVYNTSFTSIFSHSNLCDSNYFDQFER